ncbi:MAG: hypothetical protein SV765_00260 [Pseudomonadota bacterium]|nr:hypothetical protein [Pseudomonadota bacterium]
MNNDTFSDTTISRHVPVVDLKAMEDDAITALIADGYKLLDQRKRERERQARETIKQMAIEAGIKVSFRESVERKRRVKKFDPAGAGK